MGVKPLSPLDAGAVIRKCREQFHQDGQADDELAAAVTLVDGLLSEGRSVEAAKEKQSNQALAAKSTNQFNRLEFDVVSARVELVVGNLAASRRQLQHALETAHAHHLLEIEIEAQLTLAELKQKSGQTEAQTDLIALEKRAKENGFGPYRGQNVAGPQQQQERNLSQKQRLDSPVRDL
jgi:ATP/maltotriose-dependent transcriptional regulator MalT